MGSAREDGGDGLEGLDEVCWSPAWSTSYVAVPKGRDARRTDVPHHHRRRRRRVTNARLLAGVQHVVPSASAAGRSASRSTQSGATGPCASRSRTRRPRAPLRPRAGRGARTRTGPTVCPSTPLRGVVGRSALGARRPRSPVGRWGGCRAARPRITAVPASRPPAECRPASLLPCPHRAGVSPSEHDGSSVTAIQPERCSGGARPPPAAAAPVHGKRACAGHARVRARTVTS